MFRRRNEQFRGNRFELLRIHVLFLAAVTWGCAKQAPPSLRTFPVSGQITVNGKVPAGAQIRFKPAVPLNDPLKRSVEPYAIVKEDGTFQVSTYGEADGAPAGEYALTVVWPKITFEGGEENYGSDQLGQKFADPQKPVRKVEVIPGTNEIPAIAIKH